MIKLYRQEARKEERREEKVKGEEESKGGSAEGQGAFEVVVGTVPELLPPVVEGGLNFVPSSEIGREEKQTEIVRENEKASIKEEHKEENTRREQAETNAEGKEEENAEEEVKESNPTEFDHHQRPHQDIPIMGGTIDEPQPSPQRRTSTVFEETVFGLPVIEGGGGLEFALSSQIGTEGQEENQERNTEADQPIEEMEIIVDPQAEKLSVYSNLMVQYLGVAAKMLGDFVREDPATAMTLAIVSCIAIGIGVSTAGAGLVVAAAVAGAVFMGMSTAGTWCAFFSSEDNAPKAETSPKPSPTEDVFGWSWMAYRGLI